MSKPVAPQKGPTKIDLNALRELATKAGYTLVRTERIKSFYVQQAVDPLRADQEPYRDFIHRSMVRQMADFIQLERAIEITDGVTEGPGHRAIYTRGRLDVIMPKPAPAEAPAAPATDQGDVL